MTNTTRTVDRVIDTEAAGLKVVTGPFLIVLSATFAYFVAVGALLPALPLYVESRLAGSTVSVGLAVGSFGFAALILRPWAGRLGDERGRRLLVIGGAALAAASMAGYVIAKSLLVLVALRLVTGAGEALFFVGVVSAANDLAPDERRGEAMSLFSLAPYAGFGVGPMIAESMLDRHGFATVWVVAAASAAVAVLLGFRLPETKPCAPVAAHRLLHPAGLLPGAVLLTVFVGFAGFNAFVPLYARQLELGPQLPFVVFAVVLLGFRSLGAKLPDRLGAALAGRAAVTGAAIGLLTIGLWPTQPGLVVGTVIFAAGQALAFPALMALAVRRAPASERSSVVATFTAFVDLAFGIGPIGLGLVAGALGYGASFVVAAACAAFGLALLVARRQRMDALDPSPPS